jgi:cysteine desulfurase
MHTDAAQAVGKIPVDVTKLGVDLLTLVGHKMYAPKGIAALYVRRGVPLEQVIYGGGQEHDLRAGTENVAAIVALDLARGEPERLRRLRDDLHRRLSDQMPGPVTLNGHPSMRLPNTANLSMPPLPANTLLAAAYDVAASTGSACHTGDPRPSPVLTAMGVPEHEALSAVRLSLGRWSTPGDVERACAALVAAAAQAPVRR